MFKKFSKIRNKLKKKLNDKSWCYYCDEYKPKEEFSKGYELCHTCQSTKLMES
jgi:hypothetical protein